MKRAGGIMQMSKGGDEGTDKQMTKYAAHQFQLISTHSVLPFAALVHSFARSLTLELMGKRFLSTN